MVEVRVAYDKRSASSIEAYAKRLVGLSFREVCEKYSDGASADESEVGNKGSLGQLIEKNFFHYKCNNDSSPDFAEAGVELKVTPYIENAKGEKKAKERLSLSMINYFDVPNESFEDSHVWKKARRILLVYYLHQNARKREDFVINYVSLFTPPPEDLRIIKQDYETIQRKIIEGKAHELSESDTLYLGAATKAATSNDRTKQPFSKEPAKPRTFSFKNSYMSYVLNHYVIGKKDDSVEAILDGSFEGTFEENILSRLNAYIGMSVSELKERFDVTSSAKNYGAMLAYRMLGIKSNQAEEFVKANIQVKTIRIEEKGQIKESMSFPTFRFMDLVKEEWGDSAFGNYLRETRFLFVVYWQNSDGEYIFRGSQFWNIPFEDLEGEVYNVWKTARDRVRAGLKIWKENGKTRSNLPRQSESHVCHVRPHGTNAMDTYELPDGRHYTKQCFWLNNTYILSQLRDDLKKTMG